MFYKTISILFISYVLVACGFGETRKLTTDELEEEVYNHDEELWEELVDNVTQQYPKQLNEFGG